MATINLPPIITTPDQDTALADLAKVQNSSVQEVILIQLNTILTQIVATQVQADLSQLGKNSLASLETAVAQSPQAEPALNQ